MTHISRRSLLTGIAAASLISVLPKAASWAKISVDINGGNFQPLPIAIPSFGGNPELGSKIAAVIAADLKRSGLFTPLNAESFLDKDLSVSAAPNFNNWRGINAQALVVGEVVDGGAGLQARYRLWDIFAGEQMDGQQFSTSAANWRRMAHMIADAIYTRVTGESGYFDTRIAFVDEQGPKNQRVKRVAVMDQDGANGKLITNGQDLVMTPRFGASANVMTYTSFGEQDPRVYLLNVATGGRDLVGNFPGMSFAPRFAPNGRKLVFSVQENGNASIYQFDLGSKASSRLTNSSSIDTSPCFSPDGTRICFESDRGGGQQIYVMDASGGGAKRISFGDGRYATPVWSPKGDLIAFTKTGGGQFSIGVMRPDGSGERLLTSGFHAEGPSWAPNGRVIAYFKESSAGAKLYTVDISGRFEQSIPTPGFASDPSWSPLLGKT